MADRSRYSKRLSDAELLTLRELVKRRAPLLLEEINRLGKVVLTEDQREDLRQVILDEMLDLGVSEDGEANAKGCKLDEILGKLLYY